MILLRAALVEPIGAPPIPDGAVAFHDGRIAAVGHARNLRRDLPQAQPLDLGNAVLLPGLVNAHTHLELSACAAGDRPGPSFTDWILSIRGRMGSAAADPAELARQAVPIGIAQSLRFGVTCIGDISQQADATRALLRKGPIRAVSFGEALGLAGLRPRFEQLLARAIDPVHASPTLRIGLSPHAPYTVDPPGFRRCLQIARQHALPLATHLAETPDEGPFLRAHSGPFRDLWDRLGLWDDSVECPGSAGPIEFAREIGLLDYRALLAHVNYCDDAELGILASGRASIVYCPRTHAYFGHPPHRWRQMLDRGINVAVGTDSCASSPDLNLVDELRLLRRLAPEVPARTLWEMATVRAARALMMDELLGSLAPGRSADFAVFPIPPGASDPLEAILFDPATLPSSVWIAGARIV